MDATFSMDDLHDAARLAMDCPVMGHAVALARWIGEGHRPVTAGQVLRKADLPAAGAVLGVDVPPKLRTMADIPALRRPWWAAIGAGLLRVGDGQVTGGPALEHWPSAEADLLPGWLSGLLAVCAAESRPHDTDSVRLLALALLMVIGPNGAPLTYRTWGLVNAVLDELCDGCDKWSGEVRPALDRYDDLSTGTPLAGLAELLAGFGAMDADRDKPVVTVLGRWAVAHLADGLSGPADPLLPAADMIAEVARSGDEEQQHRAARKWLAGRGAARAARELLAAAASAGGKITYTYDLGAEWRHEITVEKTLVRDTGQDYPLCVAFRGDSPVEYWSEEDPAEPEPFDLADVNGKLAELGKQASPS